MSERGEQSLVRTVIGRAREGKSGAAEATGERREVATTTIVLQVEVQGAYIYISMC